jgi:hypothetical protein
MHQADRQIGMAFRATMPAVLVFGFLHGLGLSPQPSENSPASANEFVRQRAANEIKAENQDHSHWAFRLQTEKAGREETDQVVETKDGNVQLPVSVNGRPLTAKQKQQANLHLKSSSTTRMHCEGPRERRMKTLLALRTCSSCCPMPSSSATTVRVPGTW